MCVYICVCLCVGGGEGEYNEKKGRSVEKKKEMKGRKKEFERV